MREVLAVGPGHVPSEGFWMNRPRVSVLIISYNRADDLRLVLTHLLGGSLPPDEVIVVDNASKDDSADVASSFPGVIVQRNAANEGFAKANNQALARSSGDYIALLNNDAVPHHDWLRTLVERMETSDDIAGVGGKAYLWDDAHPVLEASSDYYSHTVIDEQLGHGQATMGGPDAARDVAMLSGCAVLFRRAAIDRVGHPFLEPLFFTYYEETDFCARALRHGLRLVYDGRAAVWHRVRASTASFPYHYYYHMERNRVLYAARNFDPRELASVYARVLGTLASDLRRPWVLRRDVARRARVDAALWVLRNLDVLHANRVAVWSPERSYQKAVRAIQQPPVSYYEHPRPEVRRLVPADARTVLDVGCGSGALGAELRREREGVK
ncbi:MAG: glycosyltransferase, partial [Myxococcales bacterium]